MLEVKGVRGSQGDEAGNDAVELHGGSTAASHGGAVCARARGGVRYDCVSLVVDVDYFAAEAAGSLNFVEADGVDRHTYGCEPVKSWVQLSLLRSLSECRCYVVLADLLSKH